MKTRNILFIKLAKVKRTNDSQCWYVWWIADRPINCNILKQLSNLLEEQTVVFFYQIISLLEIYMEKMPKTDLRIENHYG